MKKKQYINNNGQYNNKEHKEQTMDYSQTKIKKEHYPKVKILMKNHSNKTSKVMKKLKLDNYLNKKIKNGLD